MSQLQRLTISPDQITASPDQITAQQILLNAPQRHYLYNVLRLGQGDRFIAIDGQGNGWLASLDAQSATLLEPVIAKTELPIAVTLLIALPKNGMDDIVRQATELGVERIQPIISDRTILKPSTQKVDRWQRITQEAAEQCERQVIPPVLPPLSWSAALQTESADTCYLCEARGNHPHLLSQLQSAPLPPSIAIAIGTEGGWTEREIAAAIAAGYQVVSLGDRILRAVTAPLVALSLIAAACDGIDSGHV